MYLIERVRYDARRRLTAVMWRTGRLQPFEVGPLVQASTQQVLAALASGEAVHVVARGRIGPAVQAGPADGGAELVVDARHAGDGRRLSDLPVF